MCIRDSIWPQSGIELVLAITAAFARAVKEQHDGQGFFCAMGRRNKDLVGAFSVSYTHLDVYKRQALDTLKNLEAMGVRGFIVRHPQDGAAEALAAEAGEGTTLVNAGDGRSAHPTQGLLDALTLKQAKGPDFSKLKVLIVGDVKHSRVARSDLHALRTLGTGEIRVCGPSELLPQDATCLLYTSRCV